MSGDASDVTIPSVFMQRDDSTYVRVLLKREQSVYMLLTWVPVNTDSPSTKQAKQVSSKDTESSTVDSDSRTESGGQLFDSGQDSP